MRGYVHESFTREQRQICAQARIANDRPIFDQNGLQSVNFSMSAFCQYAAFPVEGYATVHQYALKPNDTGIYTSSILLDPDPEGGYYSRAFALACTMPAGNAISEGYRAIAAGENFVYAALNGKVYRRDALVWTLLHDFTDQATGCIPLISLHAIQGDGMYTIPDAVVVAAVYAGSGVSDHCELAVIENEIVDTWRGYLPKHAEKVNLAAAVSSDQTIHIFVDNWNAKKPLYLKRFKKSTWSAAKEILPMDALDEDSAFSIGFANYTRFQRSGQLVITGVLKRQYGPAYSIYMIGPDNFTFGRDLIAAPEYDRPLMLVEQDGWIWAIGDTDLYVSRRTGSIFGAQLPFTSVDLHSFSAEFLTNQGDHLACEVPASAFAATSDLIPGAQLDLVVGAGGAPVQSIGKFGIDRIRKSETNEGQSYTIDCSSLAMKKLLDWESDTYFDYMAQSELHGDPGDLTRLVRFSGSKYTQPVGGGLQLESLNDDGMLYTTTSASHGGFIRARFTSVRTAITLLGVGLNYGEETLSEAAIRLGKKIEEIKTGERGRWAVLAVYNPNPISGTAGKGKIWLVDYNTIRATPWKILGAVDVDQPAQNGTMWLAMQYQDGYARIYYVNSDSPNLALVLGMQAIYDKDSAKSEHENYGRGVLFLRNNSGFHMSYPILSDSSVIPLYSSAEKYTEYGTPLEDRIDRFPATNGTVKIDDEQITYAGISGWTTQRFTQDLSWVPGRVIARAGDGETAPAGTNLNFAEKRGGNVSGSYVPGNNYILQRIPVSQTEYLTAIRVWLKTVNFPEDSVMLTIHQGSPATEQSSVQLIANQVGTGVTTQKLSSAGNWVTYILSTPVTLYTSKEYYFMLRRSKNWSHPSSASYFQVKKMADSTLAGASGYTFDEDIDISTAIGGDVAFVAYGRMEDLNREASVVVKYEANKGLPASAPDQLYFKDCALAVTAGTGVNNCFRIVRSYRYTSGINDLYVFFLDRNPGMIFDLSSKLRAVPALYDLTRGVNSTTAAAHGGKSQVHLPLSIFVPCAYFEYYSADEDLTVAEVAEAIARKAGVLKVTKANRSRGEAYNMYYDTTPEYFEAYSKSIILTLTLPDFGVHPGAIVTNFVTEDHRPIVQANIWMGTNDIGQSTGFLDLGKITWTRIGNNWSSSHTTLLSVPIDEELKGDYRMSVYDGHFSIWCGGRLLFGINIESALTEWSAVMVQMQSEDRLPLMIPEAGTRVDNFVMDMGKNGGALLSTLIGEKQIFYRDDGTGGLRIYTQRSRITDHAYDRATSIHTEVTDVGLATRVLLEGGEVVEVAETGKDDERFGFHRGALQKYGNFFKTFNFNEINTLGDAQYFAGLVLEDQVLNREKVEVEGAVDLSVEPNDEIDVVITGLYPRTVVVDTVTHTMLLSDTDAVYDMHLSGRFRPDPYEVEE